MPDILVRNVDEAVLSKLKLRAKRNGRSLQNELVTLFLTLFGGDSMTDLERAVSIKESLRGRPFSDSTELLREDRLR